MKNLSIALYTLLILLASTTAYLLGKTDMTKKQADLKKQNTPSPIAAYKPSPIPQPQIRTTDPDPIVTCTTNLERCKGQTLIARRSDCSKAVCCGLLYGRWQLYADNNQCTHAQLIEQQSTRIQFNPMPANNIYYAPINQWEPINLRP